MAFERMKFLLMGLWGNVGKHFVAFISNLFGEVNPIMPLCSLELVCVSISIARARSLLYVILNCIHSWGFCRSRQVLWGDVGKPFMGFEEMQLLHLKTLAKVIKS